MEFDNGSRKIKHVSKKMKHKQSYGIACVRKNKDTEHYEILLVEKRYTYAYNDFIHGHYDIKNHYEIIVLFNEMTVDEKIEIMGLQFSNIWRRVWMNKNEMMKARYIEAKTKFEMSFLIDDGVFLHTLIRRSTGNGRLLWEIPKGHKLDSRESNVMCSVREFTEETGLSKKHYILHAKYYYTRSYVDKKVEYSDTYFIATAVDNALTQPTVQFMNTAQYTEIRDIDWFSIERLRYTNLSENLLVSIRSIISCVKTKIR